MTAPSSAPAAVTMFTTTWCGYCIRLKHQMRRAGIDFAEVNIESDPQAAATVREVNDGNETVPTLRFPDGSYATNPAIGDVLRRLGR